MSWTIESALRTTFALLRDNFVAFFVATLVFTAPSLILSLLGVGYLVTLVVGLVANVLVMVSLNIGAIRAMGGMRSDIATLINSVNRPDLGRLILLGIVQNIVTMLGVIAFIVPGLWVLSLWMVAMPAMLVEHATVGGALDRSANLTQRRRWQVLGAFLVVAVPVVIVAQVLGISTGAFVLFWLIEAALATVLVSLSAVLYTLLCGEKEGATVVQIATALG